MAAAVDRLLKQLPYADPTLSGGRKPGPKPGSPTAPRPGIPTKAPAEPEPPLAVWGRVALGVLVGIAMTQWPYRSECGFSLFLYLVAVLAVMITGAWGSVAAWRRRMAFAQIVSLIVVYWGIVLAAEQILPRIGYAKAEASWRCTAPPPPPAPPGGGGGAGAEGGVRRGGDSNPR